MSSEKGYTIVNDISLKEKEITPEAVTAPVEEAAPVQEVAPVEAAPAVEVTPVETTPVAEVSVANVPEVQIPDVVAPVYETPAYEVPVTPVYENPVAMNGMAGNSASYAQEYNIIGQNDFNSSYGEVSYNKVETTIVTEEDAKAAKEAYIETLVELYDKGPGRQISILRTVAAEMDRLLDVVSKQGFVSGKDHEEIKSVRNKYRGLQEMDNSKSFSDNQEEPVYGGMNF